MMALSQTGCFPGWRPHGLHRSPSVVGRLPIWGDLAPSQQDPSDKRIDRHQLARGFGFHRSDVLIHQRTGDADLEILEIEVLPFQAGEFAPAKPGWHIEKHYCFLADAKCPEEHLHLSDIENVRDPFPLARNPHTRAFG